MIIEKKQQNTLEIAVSELEKGSVIVLPCDTVYGFSSLYIVGEQQLKDLKGRDGNKPFLVLATKDQVNSICQDIPDKLLKIWPAPLTAILNKKDGGTLAVRVPNDEFLLKLLEITGKPIYSTSVNMSGEPLIEKFEEIVEKFGQKVPLIIKDKEVTQSLPSTLVNFTVKPYQVLRQGSFDASELIK